MKSILRKVKNLNSNYSMRIWQGTGTPVYEGDFNYTFLSSFLNKFPSDAKIRLREEPSKKRRGEELEPPMKMFRYNIEAHGNIQGTTGISPFFNIFICEKFWKE